MDDAAVLIALSEVDEVSHPACVKAFHCSWKDIPAVLDICDYGEEVIINRYHVTLRSTDGAVLHGCHGESIREALAKIRWSELERLHEPPD